MIFMVRAQLLHLSGPFRGRTDTYAPTKLTIGSADGVEVRFPGGAPVKPHHATLTYDEVGCAFHLRAREGEIFVNNTQIKEVILEAGDMIEIGRDGPKLRFRIYVPPGRVCKPVRQILSDARDVGSVSGIYALTGSLSRDLFTRSTPRLRFGFPLFLAVVVVIGAYLGGWVSSEETAKIQNELRRKQAERYERQLAKLREELEEYRKREGEKDLVSSEEVAKLRTELERHTNVLDKIGRRDAALKQVLEVYSRGVCLLHGIFTIKVEDKGVWTPLLDPSGTPVQLEYVGSGFLVSENGHVVTNRHVAEPWWQNAVVEPLIEAGMMAEFVRLEACFPGKQPVAVDISTIRISQEKVDMAVLQVPAEGVPILPLHAGDVRSLRGGKVILIGYPTGINALLARADPEMTAEILRIATDTTTLIAELAKRDAIAPVITQGALNEVKEKRLVYDAETTSGGSGGPVFGAHGAVIGVNFAVTRDFTGSNFGIPIQYAKNMLD